MNNQITVLQLITRASKTARVQRRQSRAALGNWRCPAGAGWPAEEGSSILYPDLCYVGIIFVRWDTRQDPAFALLFPGVSTFALQRSLSLLQVPLAKSCGLSSTCSSAFCFKVSFADSIYPQTPRFPQQDNESAYCFTPALFPCYYLRFSITNYSSLPSWRGE